MAYDVFISHSAKDKIIADAVCATLESEGIRCWIAPRDVMPGMEWGRSIIEAIEQAKIMVLVFTTNANTSPQIRREVERAVNHDVVILPFRIENILPDKSLEYFIGNVHWLDALTPPLEKHIDRLVGTVRALLAQIGPRSDEGRSTAPAPAEPMPMPVAPLTEDAVPRGTPGADGEKVAHPSQRPASQITAARSAAAIGTPGSEAIEETLHDKAHTVAEVAALAEGSASERMDSSRSGGTQEDVEAATRRLKTWVWTGLLACLLIAFLAIVHYTASHWAMRRCPDGNGVELTSVFGAPDGNHVWAVGSDGAIVGSDDGGRTWTPRQSGTTTSLNSISGTGARMWVVGDGGTILESDNNGASWTPRKSGTDQDLYSVFVVPGGSQIWAVGGHYLYDDNQIILESVDAGATWKTIHSSAASCLRSVFVTADGKRLWAVGDQSTMMASVDGGATWTARKIGIDTYTILYSIFATGNGDQLWIVGAGETILESVDGGATWAAKRSGGKAFLMSIFSADDRSHLWAVGMDGEILRSRDAGATWVKERSGTSNQLDSIFGRPDGSRLWAVGADGTILESEPKS